MMHHRECFRPVIIKKENIVYNSSESREKGEQKKVVPKDLASQKLLYSFKKKP